MHLLINTGVKDNLPRLLAAPADRGQDRHHQPRPGLADLPGQFPADRGDEPLPVQLLRRLAQALHLLCFYGDEIPEAHLGPAARPDRHSHRGAARRVREAQRRPAGRALGGDPGAGGSGPPAPAGTVWGRVSRGEAVVETRRVIPHIAL